MSQPSGGGSSNRSTGLHAEPSAVYIFLDVDGVLNSLRTCVAFGGYKPEHLDRAAMRLLDHLCGKLAEAGYAPRIVISSTWRMKYPDMAWWRQLFWQEGLSHCNFVGATPAFHDNRPNRRGREISAWMDHNAPCAPYVCLDDDADFMPHQPLCQTSHIWGLGLDEIDQAYNLITGQRLFMSTLRTDSKWKALRAVRAALPTSAEPTDAPQGVISEVGTCGPIPPNQGPTND